MYTDSSAFATLRNIHGEHSVMIAINGSTVHGNPFDSFSNGFHPIGSMFHAFGWPYAGFGWTAIPFKDNCSSDFYFQAVVVAWFKGHIDEMTPLKQVFYSGSNGIEVVMSICVTLLIMV